MCKRNSPDKNESQQGMCKRNSPDFKKEKKERKKANMGCVRETSYIKMKPVQDVQEKLPTEK